MNKRRDRGRGKKTTARRQVGVNPRLLAGAIVEGVLAGRGAARTHLERAFEKSHVRDRDQGLLTELVYGTVRQVGTLDVLLESCTKKGLRKVEDGVLSHMRVGAYQLLYLDNVPAGVAVSEAVAAIGKRAHVRGFVNGVLRGLERIVKARVAEDTPPANVPLTRRIPGRSGGWVVFTRDVMPDDPAEWLGAAASFPSALAALWVERYGFEQALEIARAQNAPPPSTLRTNAFGTTRPILIEHLTINGVKAEPGPRPESIRLGTSLSGGVFESLWTGLATPQDETSMGVAPFLGPQPGERIVDLCAAPGGKTTHIAELMKNEGRIDALDVAEDRLSRVGRAASRLGLKCIHTTLADPDDPRPPDGPPIDRVLVDAPCSNTGVMRRRVEVRWRLAMLDRPRLLALQARLLERGLDLVRPGGVLVYSTCSIEPEENEAQVRALLERRDDVALEEERATLPARDGGDGGYMARLRKSGPE